MQNLEILKFIKEAAVRIFTLCEQENLPISGFLFRFLLSTLNPKDFTEKQWNKLTLNQKLKYLQLK